MNSEENNLTSITNRDIENLLETVAKEEGITDFQIKIAPGSIKGDGYLGVINSAKIIGKNKENEQAILNLVVKSAKKGEALRDVMPIKLIFARETYVYSTIFPTFEEFEIKKGLNPTRFCPKFYKADATDKNEAIVLENLKEAGYRMYERRLPMDKDHVSLVMEKYGRLHAISLALKDQNPAQFNDLIEPLNDNILESMKDSNVIENLIFRYQKALESLDPVADENALKVCRSFGDKIEEFLMSLQTLPPEHSVITHGDCWTNNMMFKYNNIDTPLKPTYVDLLDFQLIRVTSPIMDLSYFFYCCSSKEILDNYEYYLKLYHETLSTHIRKLQSDPEKLFPYSTLKDYWKKYAKNGLVAAACLIHIMLSEKDEVVDLDEVTDASKGLSDLFTYEIANTTEYNKRLRQLMLHFVENEFI